MMIKYVLDKLTHGHLDARSAGTIINCSIVHPLHMRTQIKTINLDFGHNINDDV